MRKKSVIIVNPLTAGELRRIEAMKLAIAMEPGRYADADAYMADAEKIERWIEDANAPPLPAFAPGGDDSEIA